MANELNINPIKIDTVMGAGAGLGRPIRVSQVLWSCGATGGTLNIVDPTSGKVLATLEGFPNVQSGLPFSRPRKWKDFKVSAIPSGTLYIFFE